MNPMASELLPTGVQETLSTIIGDINDGQTIIFCGAGISRNSGFPIVNEFIPYVLLTLSNKIEELPAIEARLKTSKNSQQIYRQDS